MGIVLRRCGRDFEGKVWDAVCWSIARGWGLDATQVPDDLFPFRQLKFEGID